MCIQCWAGKDVDGERAQCVRCGDLLGVLQPDERVPLHTAPQADIYGNLYCDPCRERVDNRGRER